MSGFLLDTNVPSESVRIRPDPIVSAWITSQAMDTLFMSVVSFGEIRKGILLRPNDKRRMALETWLEVELPGIFLGRILPMTRSIAERWGTLDAQRQRAGSPLDVPDGQIAATALEHNLTLVTRNEKDFMDLGLTVLNPWKTT